MDCLYSDALIEAQRAQPLSGACFERIPADMRNSRGLIQGQLVEFHALPVSMIRNLRAIIINNSV